MIVAEPSPRATSSGAASRLAGVRVLDFSWIWAGPSITVALGDMGADVVKVESTARPDGFRMRGHEGEVGADRLERSQVFLGLNHSKRSIAVDVRHPDGRALLLDLASRSDLVVENFRAGTLERLGLGFDDLLRVNPKLVVVSLSGGGQSGRWSNIKSFALIASALAGYESRVRYGDEPPIGSPTVGLADPVGGAFGLLAAVAGLSYARRTGAGLYLDVSNIESMVSVLAGGVALDRERVRTGLPELVPVVRLGLPAVGADEWVAVVVSGADMRDRLVRASGLEALPSWTQLRSNSDARTTAERLLSTWSGRRERSELVAELVATGVDAFPILPLEEVRSRGHAAPNFELDHPIAGPHSVYGSPWGPVPPPRRAPLLGEHTDEVLREILELDSDEIDRLRAVGAIE